MDLPPHQLRTFLMVARRLSFTRAAEELHLTQPAVSAHVRKLERALGVPLFEQVGRRVRLTPTGEILSTYAERILALETELGAAVANANAAVQGTLAIGTSTTLGISILPGLLRRYVAGYPHVKLRLLIGNAAEVAVGLLDGSLDVGLMSSMAPDERLVSQPFVDDEIVLVVPPGHRWTVVPFIEPGDLAGEPFIALNRLSRTRAEIDRELAEQGVALDVVAELNSHIAIARMVEVGVGVGMVLKLSVQAELEAGRLWEVPVRGFRPRWPVSLHVHRDRVITPAVRAFRDLIEAEARRG